MNLYRDRIFYGFIPPLLSRPAKEGGWIFLLTRKTFFSSLSLINYAKNTDIHSKTNTLDGAVVAAILVELKRPPNAMNKIKRMVYLNKAVLNPVGYYYFRLKY